VKSSELLSFKDENQPPGGSRTKPSLDQTNFTCCEVVTGLQYWVAFPP